MGFTRRVFFVLVVCNFVLCETSGKKVNKNNNNNNNNTTTWFPDKKRKSALAVDVKVSVVNSTQGKSVKFPTRVTVVDEEGTVVYDVSIKTTRYNLTKTGTGNVVARNEVTQSLRSTITNRILVARNVGGFLQMFSLFHPYYLLRDATYIGDNWLGDNKEKFFEIATENFLNECLEKRNTTECALSAMRLYKAYREQCELYLLKHRTALALDCEMVLCEKPGRAKLVPRPVRVSVVDHLGTVLYDKVVRPNLTVKNFQTIFTGLRSEDLLNAAYLNDEKVVLESLLKDRIVVGHETMHDLFVLGIRHPAPLIRDTKEFVTFKRMYPDKEWPSLKELTKRLLNLTIQVGHHDSVEDARSAMMLYMKYREGFEKQAIWLL